MDAEVDRKDMDGYFSTEEHGFNTDQEQEDSHVPESEVSTCRICRGEETSDEALYYPCKCSGSIRYVHQACLMEWLRRSGKRHCELCKTPFRFTKLYDPRMPASVPVPVFCRQAAVQFVNFTLRLLRWALVLFVWLAWVPWVMRLMWRFLFWLADGAWIEHPFHYDVGLPGSLGTLSIMAYSRRSLPNSTIGAQVAEITHKAVSNITSKPGLWSLFSDDVSKSLWGDASTPNATASQPWMLRLGIRLFKGVFPLANRKLPEPITNVTESAAAIHSPLYRQTLLSDVAYLKNFTKWPFVNRILMDIVEGQMITVFVMVFLILVFLIREWVVQQQPRPGVIRAVAQQPVLEARPVDAPVVANRPENPAESDGADADDEDSDSDSDSDAGRHGNQGTAGRIFNGHREIEEDTRMTLQFQSITGHASYGQYSFEELRLADSERGYGQTNYDSDMDTFEEDGFGSENHIQVAPQKLLEQVPQPPTNSQQETVAVLDEQTSPSVRLLGQTVSDDTWSIAANLSAHAGADNLADAAQSQRPQMPSRNALDTASRLQRVLEEERKKVAGDRWPGVTTFMDYWNRGNCDPQVVLDLIHGEGREEELAWIVNAMKRLQRPEESGASTDDVDDAPAQSSAIAANSDLSNSSHGSWQVIEDLVQDADASAVQRSTVAPDEPRSELNATAGEYHISDHRIVHVENVAHMTGREDDHLPNLPAADMQPQANLGPSDENPEQGRNRHQPDEDSAATEQLGRTIDALASGERIPDEMDQAGAIVQRLEDIQTRATANGPEVEPDTSQSQDTASRNVEIAEIPAPSQSAWQFLADLMWGGVDLSRTQQEEVAVQLQAVFQPEMEHEAPGPIPQPQPQAQAQAQALVPAQAEGPGDVAAADEPEANQVVQGPLAPDPEVLQAAREAGIDPEDAAVEDAEDLDGLVELIGLEGPLVALLQHAVVCAAIVSLVVFLGIWIPYILGKLMLVVMSNPLTFLVKLPLRWIFFAVEVILDVFQFVIFASYFWLDRIIRTSVSPISWIIPSFGFLQRNTVIADTAVGYSNTALKRLIHSFSFSGEGLADSDIPYFSIVAHESLFIFKNFIYQTISAVYTALTKALESGAVTKYILSRLWSFARRAPSLILKEVKWELGIVNSIANTIFSFFSTNPLKLRLDFPQRTHPLDLSLIHWSAWDRFLAIGVGYLALYIAGSLYTKIVAALKKPDDHQADEAVEVIQQARGVLKVILIISIEMIAFPLYCGLLLDIAMLPLFKDATVLSRLSFSASSPWTSLFLHWFVGTCYMFHFALFVSMCRKDMRKGVLYFIRDPDDETFHPVRDVLERNLGGQLRKIGFSALVYGALVIVCLGSVVWGIAGVPWGILPVKWSTASPTTELPVDLLVYNLLIPVAVRATNPSKVLTGMYKWWFRRCAKALRLSHFLFGDRHEDEEGFWMGSPGETPKRRVIKNGVLIKSSETGDDAAQPDYMDVDTPQTAEQSEKLAEDLPIKPRFVRNGRFVRAPATDRVRIPRGHQTFLPVDENNNRLDGKPEPAEGLHAKENKQFQLVYLPPHFQTRVGLFAGLLWAFAAVTGLLSTVLPLAIGRTVFPYITPDSFPINDIHSFVLGAYLLGIPILVGIRNKERILSVYSTLKGASSKGGFVSRALGSWTRRVPSAALHLLRILYFYCFVGLILPILFSTIFWLYVAIPAFTSTTSKSSLETQSAEISLIQNWVLGILFMRVAGRAIQNSQDSQFTRALYGIVAPRNNRVTWLDPDVRLATRAFILPSIIVSAVMILLPLSMAFALNKTYYGQFGPEFETMVYRYSYPAILSTVLLGFSFRVVKRASKRWRSRIRDEVYLVGERLHNFGEKRPAMSGRVASSA